MSVLCDQCTALCCRAISLPLDNPETARDYDNIRWYLIHENVVVYIEEGQWYISMLTKCKHLQPDNRCGIYETRPRICRKYDTDNCEYHGGDYNYEALFTSGEQLVAYAEEQLGKPLIVGEKKNRKLASKVKNTNGSPAVRLTISGQE